MKPKTFKALQRKKKLIAKSWLKRSTKKVPKKNARALKSKHARYARFMASAEWRAIREAALERAGYHCEAVTHHPECLRTEQLTCHHLSYARFAGKELPEDLQVLSRPCHDMEEAKKPGLRLWQRARA